MISEGRSTLGGELYAPKSLLACLTKEDKATLLTLGRLREYEPGALLLSEGGVATFVAVVLDGFVKIVATTEEGRESLLAIRTAGDIVGELGALDGSPRLATASAAGVVRARVIPARQFAECLRAHPAISAAVTRAVVEKLRVATRRRIDFGGREAKVRLARVLLELHDGSSGEVGVLLTQSELAALIGASEPTVHKVLRSLRDQGVVHTRYRRLVIQDLPALRRLGHQMENVAP